VVLIKANENNDTVSNGFKMVVTRLTGLQIGNVRYPESHDEIEIAAVEGDTTAHLFTYRIHKSYRNVKSYFKHNEIEFTEEIHGKRTETALYAPHTSNVQSTAGNFIQSAADLQKLKKNTNFATCTFAINYIMFH
jgi:hypothetical protein